MRFRKIYSILLVLTLVSSLLFVSCGSQEQKADSPPPSTESQNQNQSQNDDESKEASEPDLSAKKTKTYQNSDEGFTFDYPDDWSELTDLSELGDMEELNDIIVFVHAPADSDFAANLNVMKTSLDDTLTATKTEMQEFCADNSLTFIDWADFDINGVSAKKSVFSTLDENGAELYYNQYFYAVGSDMYTVTCTALQSNYDKYENSFNDIMNSYAVTRSAPEPEEAAPALAVEKTGIDKDIDYYTMLIPAVTEDSLEMPQKTIDFIRSNPDLFPAKTAEKQTELANLVNSEIEGKHLSKNTEPYNDTVISLMGDLVNIEETTLDEGEYLTIAHIIDYYDEQSYILMYLGSTDYFEGDPVYCYGVPIGTYSFENVGGGHTNAIFVIAGMIDIAAQ